MRSLRVAVAALLLSALVVILPAGGPAARAPGPVRILALGDSITAAFGWQAALSQRLDLADVQHVITTRAVGGTRCSYWPSRIAALLAEHDPDVVMLLCGTNDDPAERIYGEPMTSWSVRSVYEAAHAYGAAVVPTFVQYADPFLAPGWLIDSLPVINGYLYTEIIRHISWWVGILDLQMIPASAVYLADDGIHPNTHGQATIGLLAYRALAPFLQEPGAPEPCGMAGHQRGYARRAHTTCQGG
jgi:lysophospholipase L1-like esterase